MKCHGSKRRNKRFPRTQERSEAEVQTGPTNEKQTNLTKSYTDLNLNSEAYRYCHSL